jgi:hypothetical protein
MVHALAPSQSAEGQSVLLLFSLVGLGAVTSAAATMPVAVLLVCCAITISMVLAFPAGTALDHPLVLLGLASFVAIKLRSALVTTYHTMARLKSEADLSEQGEVVRLLLNEYESNGSDWLLELDGRGCLTHVTTRFADVARRRRAIRPAKWSRMPNPTRPTQTMAPGCRAPSTRTRTELGRHE